MGSGSSAFSVTDSSLTWEWTAAGCPHSPQALRCMLHCRPLCPVSTPPCDPGCSSRAFSSRAIPLLLTRRENGFSAPEHGNHDDGITKVQVRRGKLVRPPRDRTLQEAALVPAPGSPGKPHWQKAKGSHLHPAVNRAC